MVRSALVVLLLLTGCHHKDPDGAPAPSGAPKADVTLLVYNHHWLDVNIYLIRGGSPQRLGTVNGVSSKEFTIPWNRLGGESGVRFLADPVGSNGSITTETLSVRPGAVVEWTLEAVLRQSSVSVY